MTYRCTHCNSIISQSEYEIYGGLCHGCYIDFKREVRRSGLFGAIEPAHGDCMQIKNLPCDLVRNLQNFLSGELEEEQKYVANNKPIFARTKETIEVDDLYYALLEPHAELSKFDDGTWVKISKGGFLSYGSLWQMEDGTPYLYRLT